MSCKTRMCSSFASMCDATANNAGRIKWFAARALEQDRNSSREIFLQPIVERVPPLRADADRDAFSSLEQE